MKILVFQHVDVEHPGVFRDFWDAKGFEMCTVELDEGEQIPDMEGFDLLAVMGGPMDVWQEDRYPWLIPEKVAIRRWVKDLGRPYLGICLGHQLLAEALGGTIGMMARPEVGLTTIDITPLGRVDPLLGSLGPTVETLEWHGAEVKSLPDGAEILAANAACPVQAFRWGQRAYGIQSHIEITSSMVADWARIPEYKASLESIFGKEGAISLSERVKAKLPAFRETAKSLDDNLSALVH